MTNRTIIRRATAWLGEHLFDCQDAVVPKDTARLLAAEFAKVREEALREAADAIDALAKQSGEVAASYYRRAWSRVLRVR